MIARPISEIVAQPIDWLWPGWLARGKLTLLDGDPGLGKSWIALELCVRLSLGRAWPDGAPACAPGNSMIFAGEDNDGDTVKPRLVTLGADEARVFAWPSTVPLPKLPGQLKQFEAELEDSAAQLAVLDPLPALLEPSVAANNDAVRDVLGTLERIAAARRCALLMLRGVTKSAHGPALFRGLGAMAFVNFCRLSWMAGRDPQDPRRCVLATLKNNLAAAAALAYRPGGAGIEWLGPSALTAEELARRRRAPLPARQRDRAVRFLQKFLGQGPRLARDVWRAARRRLLSRNTMKAAKKRAGVCIDRIPCRGEVLVFWRLPGQQLPDFLERSQ